MKTIKHSLLAGGVFSLSLLLPSFSEAQETKVTDPEIASIAVTANQIDVDYAAIATKKSKNKEILNFAKTMKDDHTNVIKIATDLVKKLNVTPKTNSVTKSLLEGKTKTTKVLESKSGAEFDKAYINNEVAYHEAVIKTVEDLLIPQAQNTELKDLLVKILPSLKTHLEHAKMVQKELK